MTFADDIVVTRNLFGKKVWINKQTTCCDIILHHLVAYNNLFFLMTGLERTELYIYGILKYILSIQGQNNNHQSKLL